jgi:hypothetical protein
LFPFLVSFARNSAQAPVFKDARPSTVLPHFVKLGSRNFPLFAPLLYGVVGFAEGLLKPLEQLSERPPQRCDLAD